MEAVKKVVPGTQQVQIVPVVTMGMTIVTFGVTEYTGFAAPEAV